MLKSTIKELAHSHEFKENLLTLSVNLTAGYLAKKLSKGSSNQPLKKLLGAVIIFGITKFLARRAYVLISVPLTDTDQSE